MQTVELKVVKRDPTRRQHLKALRSSGLVPANFYGPGTKNLFFAFSEKEIRKLLNNDFSATKIITLESEDSELKGKKAVIKSVERDPLSWKLLHADLYEVSMTRPITVSLPIQLKGTPTGVKDSGGILNVLRRSIKVRALLGDIPEAVEVDISQVPLGGSVHIGDIKFSDKLKVLDSSEFTLVSVVEAEKEEAVAAAVVAPDAGTGVAAAPSTAAAADGKADKKAEPAKGK